MRFGVIGWGLRRPLAELAHQPENGFELTALADLREISYRRFRDLVGSDAFVTADFRDLLDRGLDAVFILSPDYLHDEQTVACLEAGLPVYLEKPMAITVDGCDKILDTAARTGTKLYLGHNMRHFPVIRAMKTMIDKGLIGNVKTAWCRHFVNYGGDAYFRDWHADRTKSTGLLLQKGAHDIDVLHWLCGGYSKRVTAMGKLMVYGNIEGRQSADIEVSFRKTWPPSSLDSLNPVVDVEDVSMMLMELDNGVLASYQHCMFTPDAWRNYTIIGDEGRIENFGDGPGSVVRLWNTCKTGYPPEADLEEIMPEAEGSHAGADPAILAEFIRYLKEGGETDTSPMAARMSVAAGYAATQSLRNGSMPVDVL
ncbi:MAG TPA: Gfo/Idh/MocA family oxidoreductase [Fimbriimonadaceae bacterium]|jgi:predicted dehydrogenase